MERLRQGIVEKIQSDPILFGKVAYALGIKPVSLPQTLVANSTRLTQVGVIRILKNYLGMKESDLLTQVPDKEKEIA